MIIESSRHGLGIAQSPQAYGVSSTLITVSTQDVSTNQSRATASGVGALDISANYGEAAAVIAYSPAQMARNRATYDSIVGAPAYPDARRV